VNSGIGHQVGLEFGDIDVQGAVESQGGSQGRDDLSNQSVEVGVGGSLDIEVSSSDIVDCFVVEHDADIGVLKKRVGGKDGVVGLNHGGGDLGGRVDGEAELGLLAVVNRKSFQKERAKA
jgi:hypothetical protein